MLLVVTDQDILELRKAVKLLQEVQGNIWWHSLLLAIGGGVITAIPTIWIAKLSKKSEKELFFLTKEKEEKLFQLQEAKEINLIKSKLFGQIKMAESDLLSVVSDLISEYALYLRQKLIYDKVVGKEKEYHLAKLKPLLEQNDLRSKQFVKVKGELFQLIYEYNYFVRDTKIDQLINELDITRFPQIGIENSSLDELKGTHLFNTIHQFEVTAFNSFKTVLDRVVQHIMNEKK